MRRVVPLLIVLCLGFAPAPIPKPNDLQRMQGKWDLISRTYLGKKFPGNGLVLVIAGNEGRYVTSQVECVPWNFALDAKTKPRSFTAGRTEGTRAGWRGIYKVEGDTLTLCWADRGDRPTAFESKSVDVHLEEFNRKKP